MIRWLLAAVTTLAVLSPSVATALDEEAPSVRSDRARVVEIRVTGGAAALARVRITARELLLRLGVQADVKSRDEPVTSASNPEPLVVAYVNLDDPASPSIDIEEGTTRQELTRRSLSDVTSLEAGVEALLHVLYLAVESSLQVGQPVPPSPQAEKKPAPPPAPRRKPRRTPFGLDLGPLLRLSSLGGSRFVPGAGAVVEPRADLGPMHASLMFSAALHGSSELVFAQGAASVRPLQIRVVPSVDWLLSPDVSACFGLGGGLDSLMVEPVHAPELGRVTPAQSALDPMVTALLGARVPISSRVVLSALASLDLDVAPTSFVVREGAVSRPILQLPRLRGGFTLVLSFTAAGSRRFAKWEVER